MIDDEQMLWELFCRTGEPRYYSMYVKTREDNNKNRR